MRLISIINYDTPKKVSLHKVIGHSTAYAQLGTATISVEVNYGLKPITKTLEFLSSLF
jgi:hypothetical protein